MSPFAIPLVALIFCFVVGVLASSHRVAGRRGPTSIDEEYLPQRFAILLPSSYTERGRYYLRWLYGGLIVFLVTFFVASIV